MWVPILVKSISPAVAALRVEFTSRVDVHCAATIVRHVQADVKGIGVGIVAKLAGVIGIIFAPPPRRRHIKAQVTLRCGNVIALRGYRT
jgi:hypothetical protein